MSAAPFLTPRDGACPEPLTPAALSLVDRFGMLVSSLCLIHCLALPIMLAALPALGDILPGDFTVHLALILVALPLTGFALWRGSRAHGERLPLLLGLAGLLMVGAAVPLTRIVAAEVSLTVAGGLVVVCAHLLNWRAHRRTCADPEHVHP